MTVKCGGNVIRLSYPQLKMIKIGMCVGCMMLNSSNTPKVKRSVMVEVTRSTENCAQKVRHMPQTSSDSGNVQGIEVAGANGRPRLLTRSS